MNVCIRVDLAPLANTLKCNILLALSIMQTMK